METIDDYYAGESTIPEDANVPMGGYAGGDRGEYLPELTSPARDPAAYQITSGKYSASGISPFCMFFFALMSIVAFILIVVLIYHWRCCSRLRTRNKEEQADLEAKKVPPSIVVVSTAK